MLSQEPWENPSFGGGVPFLQHETTDVTASPRRDIKNRTKWELSALISSRSLDERTAVENQNNGLYLTSWCRHHNTALGSKSCIRTTKSHQDALWRFGFLSAYSCTSAFSWQACTISLALIWCHTCRAMECITSEHFPEGCLSRTWTLYLVILVQSMLISWELYSILTVW